VTDYAKLTREMIVTLRKAGIDPWHPAQMSKARWVMGDELLANVIVQVGVVSGETHVLTLPPGSTAPFLWGIPIETRGGMEEGAVELRVTMFDRVDLTPYEGVESTTKHELIVRARAS
jgi:hypothetical protein